MMNVDVRDFLAADDVAASGEECCIGSGCLLHQAELSVLKKNAARSCVGGDGEILARDR
jgi:hypothetical protein